MSLSRSLLAQISSNLLVGCHARRQHGGLARMPAGLQLELTGAQLCFQLQAGFFTTSSGCKTSKAVSKCRTIGETLSAPPWWLARGLCKQLRHLPGIASDLKYIFGLSIV